MKCMNRNCRNRTKFTLVKVIGYWNDKKKKFEDAGDDSIEYCVCDTCMDFDQPTRNIDTEGDY